MAPEVIGLLSIVLLLILLGLECGLEQLQLLLVRLG